MFMSLIHNGTLIIMNNFNEEMWYKNCIDYKISFSILVSTHIKKLFLKKINFNRMHYLKNLISVSDVLEDEIRKKILKYKFNFHEIYGAAEISTVANIKHRSNSKSKSVGKILPFVKVKIIKNNKFCSDEEIGEIICKTPLKFKNYYKDEKETKNSFFKGFFKTGDLGYIKNNYLFFSGRIKNMIKISGISVFPEDIEKILKRNKYVKDCVIKSEYDKINGSRLIAMIEGNKTKEDDIYFYCLKNLEIFQVPSKIVFVESFERTNLGKIKRNAI